jgi:hypothetical protein
VSLGAISQDYEDLCLERRASILLEGSGEEYTEIAIGCQDYFRLFQEYY